MHRSNVSYSFICGLPTLLLKYIFGGEDGRRTSGDLNLIILSFYKIAFLGHPCSLKRVNTVLSFPDCHPGGLMAPAEMQRRRGSGQLRALWFA